MSTVWIAVVMAAAPPYGPGVAQSPDSSPAVVTRRAGLEARTGVDLRNAVRAALRRWARVGDQDAQKAAREFLVLFHALRQDDKIARSQREQYIGKVRGRLFKLSQQIRKRAAIQRRLAKSKRPRSVDAANKGNAVLAQQFGGFGGGGFGGGGLGGGMMGGPMMGGAMMGGGGPGGGGRVSDNGEELVELIQATVAPSTWDVNGGPGAIIYWRTQHALVIRQTDEVHEDIANLLEQLNRMNR